MPTADSHNPWHQVCLGKLQQILDLAMQTAEAASIEGNHKIVLQAAREVTRIITLMTKLNPAPESEDEAPALTSPTFTAQFESPHPASAPHRPVSSVGQSGKPKKAGGRTKKDWEISGTPLEHNQLLDDIIPNFNTLRQYEENAARELAAATEVFR